MLTSLWMVCLFLRAVSQIVHNSHPFFLGDGKPEPEESLVHQEMEEEHVQVLEKLEDAKSKNAQFIAKCQDGSLSPNALNLGDLVCEICTDNGSLELRVFLETQFRTRTITKRDAHGGNKCPTLKETRSCQIKPCPINCGMTGCCGGGKSTSTRKSHDKHNMFKN